MFLLTSVLVKILLNKNVIFTKKKGFDFRENATARSKLGIKLQHIQKASNKGENGADVDACQLYKKQK